MQHKPRGTPLPASTLAALRASVDKDGILTVARRLGISGNAIRQALAGLGVIHGTALAIEVGLRQEARA